MGQRQKEITVRTGDEVEAWQRDYAADTSVIGNTIYVNTKNRWTVVWG